MRTRRDALHRQLTAKSDSDFNHRFANAGLWLDKFIHEQGGNAQVEPKQQLVKKVSEIETPKIYQFFFENWENSLTQIGARMKRLKINGRMVIGLGAENVLETSIALHRTYGVPFISGSSLKGLAAKYAHQKLDNEAWQIGGKAHNFVFGSPDSAGFLTFYDALLIPDGKQSLHADVLTVHHQNYYQGTDAPADWDSPVPVPFLSATGSYLLALSGAAGAEKWLDFTLKILERALREEGIGAKTASGYGRAELIMTEVEKTALREQNQDAKFEKWRADIKTATDAAKLDKDVCKNLEKTLRSFTPEQKRQGAGEFLTLIGEERGSTLAANKSEWYKKVGEAAEGK